MTGGAATFAGRFHIGALLGTGGTAAVYAATDEATGAELALKVLHPHLAGSRASRRLFLAEAERASSVRHPGVVAVLDAGESDVAGARRPWIAAELVRGRSLGELVTEDGPLGLDAAVALLREVAAGLAAVHAAGLVHRDLTPANILLDELPGHRMRARIADLGLADVPGQTVRTGRADRPSVMGSADFMSPELLRGDPADARSDLYQLGAVGYFAVTGAPPFPRGTVQEVLDAQLFAPPPPPSVLRAGVPRDLDRLLVAAMLKRPGDRPASAAAVEHALERMSAPRRGPNAPTIGPPGSRTLVLTAEHLDGAARRPPVVADAPRAETADPRPVEHLDDRRPTPQRDYVAIALALAILLVAGVGIAWALLRGDGEVAAAPETTEPAPVTQTTPPAARPTPAAATEVVVPDLASLPGEDAVAALAALGLTSGTVTTIDAPRGAGTVLATDPAAGSSVPAGHPVDLVLASGRNTVPDVAGTEVEAAVALVQRAGFSVTRRAVVPGPGTATLAQGVDPGAGTVLPIGSLVTVLVPMAEPTDPADDDPATGTEDAG